MRLASIHWNIAPPEQAAGLLILDVKIALHADSASYPDCLERSGIVSRRDLVFQMGRLSRSLKYSAPALRRTTGYFEGGNGVMVYRVEVEV